MVGVTGDIQQFEKTVGKWYGVYVDGEGYVAGKCKAANSVSAVYKFEDGTSAEVPDKKVYVGPEDKAIDVWFALKRKFG